jgi:pyrophosphatase PpaX
MKTILFDWDQVLVNSLSLLEIFLKELKTKHNFNMKNITVKNVHTKTIEQTNEIIMNKNPDKNIQELRKLRREFFNDYTKLKLLGLETIKKLRGKGIKTGIISNATKIQILQILKENKKFFDVILSYEDGTGSEDKTALIIRAIKELNVKPEETAYIGDHINDIKYAKKAGVISFAYPNKSFTEQELKQENPDYLIKDLKQLLEVIENE